jgi:hypothetical protein
MMMTTWRWVTKKDVGVTICAAALSLAICLHAQPGNWNRIDVLCVVRDAHSRPIANLTKDRFQVLDGGETRSILEFSRAVDQPQIETVVNGSSLYADAYFAIWRKLAASQRRKILVLDDRRPVGSGTGVPPVSLTPERQWELILMAERRHVVIYVLGDTRITGTPLGNIAAQTGGRVVTSERELRADLDAQYHIVAQPSAHGADTGVFRSLEVRVSAAGSQVQAPHAYYITPPWSD